MVSLEDVPAEAKLLAVVVAEQALELVGDPDEPPLAIEHFDGAARRLEVADHPLQALVGGHARYLGERAVPRMCGATGTAMAHGFTDSRLQPSIVNPAASIAAPVSRAG